ncbi:hypothetical protein EDB86DRAFT_2828399 [Lactarius hatsudake]|nr:hypothetical protein EDB86DRAFT_2828399 [Lactarius hatsudake]
MANRQHHRNASPNTTAAAPMTAAAGLRSDGKAAPRAALQLRLSERLDNNNCNGSENGENDSNNNCTRILLNMLTHGANLSIPIPVDATTLSLGPGKGYFRFSTYFLHSLTLTYAHSRLLALSVCLPYTFSRKWTLTLGDDTTSAVYRHGLVGSVSQLGAALESPQTRIAILVFFNTTTLVVFSLLKGPPPVKDPHELILKFPSWAVDMYPIGSVCHKAFLYLNKHVGWPYGYIYIVDHPTWTSIVAVKDPPVGIPQSEDIHAYIALNGDLAPHPAEYPDAPANRLWFKLYRITATNEA